MTPDSSDLLNEGAPHLAQFGLLSEPFGGTDGPHFFYADANREQRLDLMQHLAPYSEVLIVVGAPGSGKTMLLQQFVARAGETWRTVVVSAQAGMSREEFMTQLMDGFGLPMDDAIPLERRHTVLIDHLHALRQSARMPILIVDDAHHLDADVMELILTLCEENDTSHLLSVMLFGTPQLQANLASPALAPLQGRVAHTFDVPALSEHDTGRYLRHRMRAAGARDEGPFTPEVITKIHAASGGMPFAINEMAHNLLTERAGAGSHSGRGPATRGEAAVKASEPQGFDKRWIAAALAGLAIVGVLVAGRFTDETPPAETTAGVSLPPADGSRDSRVLREEAAPGAEAPPTSSEPPVAQAETDSAAPPVAPPGVEQPPVPAAPLHPDNGAKPAAVTPPAQVQVTPPAPVARTQQPTAPPTAIKQADSSANPAMATESLKREEWVRAQPAANYTLQLMALREEQTVRDTVARHKLRDAAYFPIQRNGQTLYVLVQGSYPSRAAADQAATQLPAGLVDGQPWPRKFRALHKELAK